MGPGGGKDGAAGDGWGCQGTGRDKQGVMGAPPRYCMATWGAPRRAGPSAKEGT